MKQYFKIAKEHDIKAKQLGIQKAFLNSSKENMKRNLEHEVVEEQKLLIRKVEMELEDVQEKLEIAKKETMKQNQDHEVVEEQKQLIRKVEIEFEDIQKKLVIAKKRLEVSEFKEVKWKNHFEEIFWRFPHLGTQLLENLDHLNLIKCREVNVLWKKSVDDSKSFQIKQILYYFY